MALYTWLPVTDIEPPLYLWSHVNQGVAQLHGALDLLQKYS